LIPFPQAEVAVFELVPVLEADLELDGVTVFEAVLDWEADPDGVGAAGETDEAFAETDEGNGETDEPKGDGDDGSGESDDAVIEPDETEAAIEMDETEALAIEIDETDALRTVIDETDTLREGEIPCELTRVWIAKKAKTKRICFIILKSYWKRGGL